RAFAAELRRRRRGRSDRPGGCAADSAKAIRLRQLEDRRGVDHAARDTTLHHQVALVRRMAKVCRHGAALLSTCFQRKGLSKKYVAICEVLRVACCVSIAHATRNK